MDPVLDLIGRSRPLFQEDLRGHEPLLRARVEGGSFLVIGGAGSIGQAVVKELFRRRPRVLHVIDLSENNLVELVRDIRSSLGYIEGEFRALPLDCGSVEFAAFLKSVDLGYDYVLNLSALKHVRSEKDPYSLMRMVETNILNTERLLRSTPREGGRFFCVSTDKATRPVNLMGASKRIMELFLLGAGSEVTVSTARFANVAFSDGSLLHGFDQRIKKRQPLAAPSDVRRYFINFQEAGQLCLMASLLAENRELFFPQIEADLRLITFSEIAERYLLGLGYRPRFCSSEDEARRVLEESIPRGEWPCYFFRSDTTGEKEFEEFYTDSDQPDLGRFRDIGVLQLHPTSENGVLESFLRGIDMLRRRQEWTKDDLVRLFREVLPDLVHDERGKYLDSRM